jgi:hypothetical protein
MTDFTNYLKKPGYLSRRQPSATKKATITRQPPATEKATARNPYKIRKATTGNHNRNREPRSVSTSPPSSLRRRGVGYALLVAASFAVAGCPPYPTSLQELDRRSL